jgi:hypothetical protein
MSSILLNGTNVSSGNVNVVVFGQVLIGVTKITYSRTAKHVMNYGLGQEPISIGRSEYTYSGSITVYTETWFDLYNTLGFSPLQAPPTTLSVTVAPSPDDLLNPNSIGIYTDDLFNVVFLNDEFSVNSGDTKTELTIPFILSGIDRFGA